MAEFDNEESLREAKARLPLHRLMEQHGDSVRVGRKWGPCPFCKHNDTARITSNGDQEFFKCANFSCPTDTSKKPWTELHYLKFKTGLNDKESFIAYLKEAGVWREPEKKSVSPTPPAEKKPEQPIEESPKNIVPLPGVPIEAPEEKKPDVEEIPGRQALKYFYDKLAPTETLLVASLPSGEKLPELIPASLAKNVRFAPATFFEKRGLTTSTCRRLGFAANPESNLKFLQEIERKFDWKEVKASGLWHPARKENRKKGLSEQPKRPNKQFFGLGQIGKKPEGDRRQKDDKWVWGICEPVLIPYFDEMGSITKLRPHKGGAPEGTLCGAPRLYIPRDFKKCGDQVENFKIVVICEGEFKAAAVWQVLGLGREDGKMPIGVCAVPGINFGKHFELRMELEAWLQQVGCEEAIVAFDDQDKSSKPMKERHDAFIWAKYLASDLSRKLHIRGQVLVLPREWRDSKGKADWDGALAKIVQEKGKASQ